jgi:hypothetical protein
MKINLSDIVTDTYTNASGYSFYVYLKRAISNRDVVEVSFKDTSAPSSSFLNSSFGTLIEEIGLQEFLSLVKPRELTPTQAQMLRHYIQGFKSDSTKH